MNQDNPSFSAVIPQPRARKDDPDTSHEAARRISRRNINGALYVILDSLAFGKQCSDQEILLKTRFMDVVISPSGCRTRRHELVQIGLVEDTGLKGKTPAGNSCTLWQLTKLGTKVVILLKDKNTRTLGELIMEATSNAKNA